ncbi:unnamed protein product, partial [Schistosoma curassoni]|uniref:Ovule protein n=1 Tax=Schistosoma curassoni TaxID=6186 RepID=A0A183KVZ7_9TREM
MSRELEIFTSRLDTTSKSLTETEAELLETKHKYELSEAKANKQKDELRGLLMPLSGLSDDQSSTSDKVSWIDDRDIVKCNTDSLASCIHTSPIHRNNQVSTVEEVPEIVGQHESFLEEESNANPTISSPPSTVADNPELNQKSFISPDLPKLYT